MDTAEGETAEFRCLADGFPKPTIKWTRNGVRPLVCRTIEENATTSTVCDVMRWNITKSTCMTPKYI